MSALLDAETRLHALGPKPFPLPLGRMAPIVEGAFTGFGRKGWVLTGPRERVGATLRGCPVERLVDPAAGARPYKLAPCSDAPGDRALHAVGLALATGEPVLCLLGLASAASGAFYEALNTAALLKAPVIFLVTVQTLDPRAPVSPQISASPAALARACGLATAEVPGTAEAVAKAVAAAVATARETGAPFLLAAILE